MEVYDRLRKIDWSRFGISYVLLFGSMVYRVGRDIDLAIKFFENPPLEVIGEIVEVVSKNTGYPEDRVDIIILNRVGLSCELVYQIYCSGKKVFVKDEREYLDDYLRWIKICYDYSLMTRKIGVQEKAIEVVKREWGL